MTLQPVVQVGYRASILLGNKGFGGAIIQQSNDLISVLIQLALAWSLRGLDFSHADKVQFCNSPCAVIAL
ncbi:hypothetical protein [Desulfogranum marinum]|uniref:hypothetical protein n=1 Tax=Desulfogranum marinum TaxID=453220 RepID=UPI0019653F2A|nr:hypothetical protein [Desulfogranum marinum]MBM9515195.1 hypothetical protein [Desulfogranum marinum]